MSVTPGTAPAVPYPQVTPEPGSRLEQLLDMREAARAVAREAADRVKAIEAGIMADAGAAWPGQLAVNITGSPHRAPLRMRWHPGKWYADGTRMKTEDPAAWERWRKQAKGYWQLHDLHGS